MQMKQSDEAINKDAMEMNWRVPTPCYSLDKSLPHTPLKVNEMVSDVRSGDNGVGT